MRNRTAILLSAVLATGCDLEAEAESKSVCVTQVAGTSIPGVPGAGVSVTTPPVAFTLDVGSAIPGDAGENGVEADAIAQSITLTSPQGVDLSGVTSAQATLVAPGRPPVVFRYARPPGATAPITAIATTPETPVDLVDYAQGTDRIRLENVTVTGTPPAQTWTPTLVTCAATKVTVDYLDAAGL